MNRYDAIGSSLRKCGIQSDDTVLIHSSFKRLSYSGFEIEPTIEAFLTHLKNGCVLMPSMSWRYVNKANPVFDVQKTPSNTGALAEAFRKHYAVSRSLHPTHSVSGLGTNVDYFLGEHHVGNTPCSRLSPFGKLIEKNGWVIMLATGFDCCTLLHHAEEQIAPDIYLKSEKEIEEYSCIDCNGNRKSVFLRGHKFLPRNYWQFQDLLATHKKMFIANLDNVVLKAFRAQDLWAVASSELRNKPDAILSDYVQRYRMM